MPIYGIIGVFGEFFVHKSAKCQYLLMKPSLLDMYYKITYFLKFLGQNILKCGFYAQKPPKMDKNGHISFRAFSLSHTT